MTEPHPSQPHKTSDPLVFLFKGELVELRDLPPTLTLLQWLRYHANRPGTKEGCAEGDCGACTVLLGELAGDTVAYRSVDSCLVLMPMLHGREVLTVEDLRSLGAGDTPHPVQANLVEKGGSQCGFCTPGFVMSLLHVFINTPECSREQVEEGISGNLCRCTGYRPIVEAGQALGQEPYRAVRKSWEERVRRHGALLRTIPPASTSHHRDDQHLWRVTSLEEATRLLAQHPGADLLSGGTDLALEVTKRRRSLSHIIYLGDVPELKEVDLTGPWWRFGGGLTYAEWMPLIQERLPALHHMFSLIGSPQIRHLGTVGGNLGTASPIGDSAPALLAYGAEVELASVRGRRRVPLAEYFVGYRNTLRQPDELISAILIPVPPPTALCLTYKISRRRDMDISAVSAVYYLERGEGGRVVKFRTGLGGVAATPTSSPVVEQFVMGKMWEPAVIDEAAALLGASLHPISDHRGSAEFRQVVLANALRQFGHDSGGV